MAGTAIVRKDTRLLLFQALECAKFEGLFFDQFKKSGAGMAYELAKKYYSVTSEPGLIAASYCVLGICNLGLVLETQNDLEAACRLLQSKTLLEIFQLGWKKVAELITMKVGSKLPDQNPLFKDEVWQKEKDLVESFSAEPGKDWIGLEEYRETLKANQKEYLKRRLHDYLTAEHIIQESVIHTYYAHDPVAEHSLFVSLLLPGKMHAPLSLDDFGTIFECFKHPQIASILEKKLKKFSQSLPVKSWRKIFLNQAKSFLESNEFVRLAEMARNGQVEKASALFVDNFWIKSEADKISRARYFGTKSKVSAHDTGIEDIIMSLSLLSEEMDISEKMAIIDVAISPKFIGQLPAEQIVDIIEEDQDLWRGKISWHLLDDQVFLKLLEDLSEVSRINLILADIFQKQPDQKMLPKLQQLPAELLCDLCRDFPAHQNWLLKKIVRHPQIFSYSDSMPDHNIVFIPAKSWFELWDSFTSEGNAVLFKKLIGYYEEMNLPPPKAMSLFLQRVLAIAKAYKKDLRNRKKDYPVCQAPYYNENLKKAVAKALLPKQFKDFSKNLMALL